MAVQHRLREGSWSSEPVFILALIGAAAGFGNVWKFPYLVGTNGGGAFLVLYLLCLAGLATPLLAAEIMLGRRGRGSPVRAYERVAALEGRWPAWQGLGWMSLVACGLLLATYSVVGGWSIAYVFRTASGMFMELDTLRSAEVFQQLIRDPERLLAWHTLFLAVTVMIVGRGVRLGLEEAARWFMPMLAGLLLLLTCYAMLVSGRFLEGLGMLLLPDFSALSWQAVPKAMSHAFYSLTVGLGVALAYGSYVDDRVPIFKASAMVAVGDTLIGLLAGLVVLPILLGAQFMPSSGPAVIFQSLPLAFGQLPNGTWFGTLFFLLLVFAAWTSSIALLEPMVAHLTERYRLDRVQAAGYIGLFVWILGVAALLSFSIWAHVRPLRMLEGFRDSTLFELFSHAAANILLPIGGLLVAIFVGWRLSVRTAELELGSGRLFRIWRFLIRYVVPVGMLMVLADAVGFL